MPLPSPDDLTDEQREEILSEFWSDVHQSGEGDACWGWQGNTVTGRPHGRFYARSQGTIVDTTASRFAARWLLEVPLSEGSVVTRKCGNPQCVRPSHLKPCESKQEAVDYRESLDSE